MRRHILLYLFLFIAACCHAQMVYEVPSPVMADVTYCIVPNEIMADVVVYKAKSQTDPGIEKNEGVWYFCTAECMAQINVSKVIEPAAQLKVCFTDNQIFAGWRNENKRKLMETGNQ